MRRMNSVCFVQSRLTLWDTVFFIFLFFLMAHLMLPEKTRGFATAKTEALSFADSCDPLGVKWMSKFLSACYQFTFQDFLCVCVCLCDRALLFFFVNTVSLYPLSLQWTRTRREAPDRVASPCPRAATTSWDPD